MVALTGAVAGKSGMNELIAPLADMINSAEVLLSEEHGMLTALQERFLDSIRRVTNEMYTLFLSTPMVEHESVKALLSYETREHLASIIGYAEVLLEQTEGTLSETQIAYVQQIRTSGRTLLKTVSDILDS